MEAGAFCFAGATVQRDRESYLYASLALTGIAALAVTTACGSTTAHSAPASPAPPHAIAAASPPAPSPLGEGDVHNDDTTFHLHVASVRTQHSYSSGGV
ncbi:MAG: hypothetical protein JWR24_5127 [Actinoallomurus sp.]|jgi:hypothetical protein|nr:hypothetical protein [Actinoallomurus sp.]